MRLRSFLIWYSIVPILSGFDWYLEGPAGGISTLGLLSVGFAAGFIVGRVF